MQRGIYAIAVSDRFVEGGLVVRGEAQPAFSLSSQAPPAPAAGPGADGNGQPPQALLEDFLRAADWELGMAVLVLPTERVSTRYLHFQFSDLRKIRQVLPIELESELLDSIAEYAFDFDVLPRGDGSADVLAYLVPRAGMQALVEAMERRPLSVQRVTFAAQALVAATPPPEGCHFTVYIGSEETFVVHSLDGRTQAIQSLQPHPGGLLAEIQARGPGSPTDRLQALFRAAPDDAEAQAVCERLKERLEAAREWVNRALRVQSAGQPFSVSLHGLFGELFAWQPGAASVSLRFPEGAWPGARRAHMGVLEDLLARPRAFPTMRGLNLHHRVGTWIAGMRELRWPLISAGVLLLVLLSLMGTAYFLRTSALQARLDAAGRELQRMLHISQPITSITVNSALKGIQDRVDKARKEREAMAYIDRYHYDTLRLFSEISDAVHQQPGITVDALSFNQERFSISGSVPSYEDSESLKNRVGGLERFKGRTVKVTNSNVGKVIRYRLSVER